jgi:glycerol-3-phosphate dehydrogenase
MYDVVIIGGGVVGAMTARKLSEFNLKVCVVEKGNDVAQGATKANSAIVHAGFDAECGSLKAALNVQGSRMMKQVTEELDVKYENNGSLVIGFDDEDRKTIEELLARGNQNGVEGLRIVEKDELKAMEPNISDNAVCALYAPTGAIVCPYELTIAAMGNAMDNGAELLLNFKVTKIEDGYRVYAEDGRMVEAKYIVNAAGLYSDEIAGMVGDDSFSVFPRRGEYILLDKECGNHVSHTIFRTPSKMGKGILLSPTVDGNLLAGPTSENKEDKTDKDTTQAGLAKVMKEAQENVDNLFFGKAITSFSGLRAVGSTGDFIITSPKAGFVNAAGIESPGLSAAPAIALYITNMLKELGLVLEAKENYNPYRKSPHFFRNASLEEKNEIIKKDSRFGHIICRCETITEGEIVYALHQNPKPSDLDGVKRRTRAQMGRCQGGFCSPLIVELISQELGIPYEKVTKTGGNSLINIGKTKGEGSNV